MVKTVNLIGPIEPTGLSWLINCLIELNIKCSIDSQTWNQIEGEFQLRPEKNMLRRWLPALSDTTRKFNFRNEIEVNWSHDWINQGVMENKTVFFTREPKTALFSGYKRLGTTELSFYDYLNEIDPQWLLNRMQIWNLFHGLWLNHPEIKVFLFEDYKENAIETLKSVVEYLQIDGIQHQELVHAVEASSFEMAKKSEEKYLFELDIRISPMIRQGSIKIEDEDGEQKAYELIDLSCGTFFDDFKDGISIESQLRKSELNSHVFDYLERNMSLVKYFPLFVSAGENMSAYRHISRETIEISKKNPDYSHLISAVQRKILRNILHDLRLLTALKNGRFPASNLSLAMVLLKIIYIPAFSMVKRSISRFRNH